MTNYLARLGVLLTLGVAIGIPIGAMAEKTSIFKGRVVHISTNNIKVRGASGQELGFLILPHFGKIFHSDGKTTVQMKDIRAGDRVEIMFDQSALGARHADEIIDADAPLRPMKS